MTSKNNYNLQQIDTMVPKKLGLDLPIWHRNKDNTIYFGLKIDQVLYKKNEILIYGWQVGVLDEIELRLDGEIHASTFTRSSRSDVAQALGIIEPEFGFGFQLQVKPDALNISTLKPTLFWASGTQMGEIDLQAAAVPKIYSNIDSFEGFLIKGWASIDSEPVKKFVLICNGLDVDVIVRRISRPDVAAYLGTNSNNIGFEIEVPGDIWEALENGSESQITLVADDLTIINQRDDYQLPPNKAAEFVMSIFGESSTLDNSHNKILALEHISYGYLWPYLDFNSREQVHVVAKKMGMRDLIILNVTGTSQQKAIKQNKVTRLFWNTIKLLSGTELGKQVAPAEYVKHLLDIFDVHPFNSMPSGNELPGLLADYLVGKYAVEEAIDVMPLKLAQAFYLLASNNNQPWEKESYLRAFGLLEQLQDYTHAIPIIIHALRFMPSDVVILIAAAEITKGMEDFSLARLLISRALEINPQSENPELWELAGTIHDAANRAGSRKYGTLEKWLAQQSNAGLASKLTSNCVSSSTQFDNDRLQEFMRLLGEVPPELLIDLEFYQGQANAKFESIEQVLKHYFAIGWQSGLNVHPALAVDFIQHQLRSHGINTRHEPLLILFLLNERQYNVAPNALFDPQIYRLDRVIPTGQSPWLHYLNGGWRECAVPSSFFDEQFYLSKYKQSIMNFDTSPLLHYFCNNPMGSCNPLFHDLFYLDCHKEKLQGRPPLEHYLTEGAYMGYAPNPFYSPSSHSAQERLDYLRL